MGGITEPRQRGSHGGTPLLSLSSLIIRAGGLGRVVRPRPAKFMKLHYGRYTGHGQAVGCCLTGGAGDACLQQWRIYIRIANKDVSVMLKDRGYACIAGLKVGPPLLHGHGSGGAGGALRVLLFGRAWHGLAWPRPHC